MNEWISVKDKLPEVSKSRFDKESKECIITDMEKVTTGFYSKGKGWRIYDTEYLDNVTHWMPLPEPPKQKP